MTQVRPKVRCATYCRKSSEEGLDQAFNSLDAQRDACAAYIQSQRQEGWIALDDRYDDPGVSGGTLERPGLKRLIRDIEAGLVDTVVCYKIDRLSRSLSDFTKLIDVFERRNVTFVSVTQSFCTTTSMGRLTLNILLSFAQFERELAGERIRDKFLASRRKGIFMGGHPPFAYFVRDRKLIVKPHEAELVRHIFTRFLQVGSATLLVQELRTQGHRTRQGRPFDKGKIYKLLRNRTYVGEVEHKGVAYPGEHEAIIDRTIWERVQAILSKNGRRRAARTRAATPALLKGLIYGPDDRVMAPSHTRRRGRLYRFYRTASALKLGHDACPIRAVPAGAVEGAVIGQLRALLRAPEVVVRTWRMAQAEADVDEREVVEALQRLDPLWDQLFPAEQARIVQLLVERVTVRPDGLEMRLRVEGIGSLVEELRRQDDPARRAA